MTGYSSILEGYTQEELATTTSHSHQQPYDTAVLNILEDGSVSLTIDTTYTSNDGTPARIWHGLDLEYTINGNPDIDDLAALLDGKAGELIDRIIAGHDSEWDGSNFVGTMTEDAKEASEELSALLYDASQSSLSAWSADDWLGNVSPKELLRDCNLTTSATDAEIEAAAASLVSDARVDSYIVSQDGIETVIREYIARVREDEDEDEDAA